MQILCWENRLSCFQIYQLRTCPLVIFSASHVFEKVPGAAQLLPRSMWMLLLFSRPKYQRLYRSRLLASKNGDESILPVHPHALSQTYSPAKVIPVKMLVSPGRLSGNGQPSSSVISFVQPRAGDWGLDVLVPENVGLLAGFDPFPPVSLFVRVGEINLHIHYLKAFSVWFLSVVRKYCW